MNYQNYLFKLLEEIDQKAMKDIGTMWFKHHKRFI